MSFMMGIISFKEKAYSIGILMVIGGLLFTLADAKFFQTKEVTVPVKQYEVTFNEDVSFTEIYDNYNVIEKRGDIYVIREKVNVDKESND